jgi:hypothetical protein
MFPDSVLALKSCSNAILGSGLDYGKSPCFSRSWCLCSGNVDGMGSPFTVLYIEVFQV